MRKALIMAALLLVVRVAGAQDDMQAVGAVWSDFVDSLRRGAYANAHSLFSPESRAAMPYAEFVAEYGPLSVAREMVLAKPESLGTTIDGDWAAIAYGGTNPGTGRKFRVGVSLVRNRGGWGLVAARNEIAERVEAGARALLGLVWDARGRGTPKELVAALNAAQAKNPVLQMYRIETDGRAVRAFPLKAGLRTFYLDGTGMVKAVGEPDAPPPAQAAPAAALRIPEYSVLPGEKPLEKKEAPAILEDGMPELSEPPPWGAADLEEEIAEPPPRSGRSRAPGPPEHSLPDTIQ
ncbi:MAG: hypothetical protein LBS30_02085 [Planctomycetota bacterium]|jgi:hypothetical protein|nr:hypothetical protein [Planctomycetota bacterium]